MARNVALRLESRGRPEKLVAGPELTEIPADESSLSAVFDRAWARAVVQQAARRQRELAELAGPAAVRRVELLHLRFQEGKPIREIARLWQADAEQLHREYAKARAEFRDALTEVVGFHHPGAPDEVERECRELMTLLQ